MAAYRHHKHTSHRTALALAAAFWPLAAVLAGCGAAPALGGHPPSTLPASGPGTASSPASPGSPTTPGTGGQSTSATTAPPRPYRPNSVVLGFFHNTLFGYLCTYVAAGSSDTAVTIERFGKQDLCFDGLDAAAPPSIVITTPGGARETFPLTGDGPGEWDWPLLSVPGGGPEASLGVYAFQVTTVTAGSGSGAPSSPAASPSAGPGPSVTSGPPATSVTTSGHFTVIPAAEPAAVVGSDSRPPGREGYLAAGSQLTIWFSGFPGFTTIYVSLYGPGVAMEYPLLTDLPGLKTDGNGEGEAVWPVPAGAAAGRYAIWIDPPPQGCVNPCTAFDVTP
jgi:hypothetical protein